MLKHSLKLILLCLVLSIHVCRPATAQTVAPGLVIHQITNDGKSSTERGAGFASVGDQIVFYKAVSKTDRQLWLMRGDGSQSRAISPVGWPMLCAWAPDGKTIAYVFANKNEDASEATVCVYTLAGGETKRTSGGYRRSDFGAAGNAPPVWSPDCQRFVYQIYDRQRDGTFVTVFPIDGSAPVRLGGTWLPRNRSIRWDRGRRTARGLCSMHFPRRTAQPELWVAGSDGTALKQITNDRRDCGEPKWSPDGQWIVFFSAKDRYPEEVRLGWYWDLLLVRPDGTDEQTLASGRSQSSEGRGAFVHPFWAPDGSFIVCHGTLADVAGRDYSETFLVDWRQRKWHQILGTLVGSRECSSGHDWAISPDSTRIFRHGSTYVLRGAGDGQATDPGDDFAIYDVRTGTAAKLLYYRRQKDPYYLYNHAESWAPDSARILICQAKAISWQKEEFEPDLYVLEEPGVGTPPTLAPSASAEPAAPAAPPTPAAVSQPTPAFSVPTTAASGCTLIQPMNMTAQQALDSLPAGDKAYAIINPERNLLIVNGPPDIAQRIRDYLRPIDTPAPQVVMDVLVTEMSKTASRTLGLDWSYAKGHVGVQLPIGDNLGPGQFFYQGVQRLDDKFFAALERAGGER